MRKVRVTVAAHVSLAVIYLSFGLPTEKCRSVKLELSFFAHDMVESKYEIPRWCESTMNVS